jgi:hypothetical protein
VRDALFLQQTIGDLVILAIQRRGEDVTKETSVFDHRLGGQTF